MSSEGVPNRFDTEVQMISDSFQKMLERSIEDMHAQRSDSSLDFTAHISIQRAFLNRLGEYAGKGFEKCDKELRELVRSMRNANLSDDEFTREICPPVAKILRQKYTVEEIEDILRHHMRDSKKWQESGRAILYEVIKIGYGEDEKAALILHVPPILNTNPLRLKEMFIDSFKALAEQVRTDPHLASVGIVTGTSWLVAKYAAMIRQFHFSIRNEDVFENKRATLEMSREDFLDPARPWNRGGQVH